MITCVILNSLHGIIYVDYALFESIMDTSEKHVFTIYIYFLNTAS